MKYLYLLLLIFIVNCSGNKVTNYHGVKLLDKKIDKIEINITNKNDLIKLIGNPSTVSDFDKNRWYYFERLKTNQSLIKLGNQKIKKNNVLIVDLNDYGIVKNKKLLNIDDMNDVKKLSEITEKDFENKDILYGVFSSLREKINAPARNRTKNRR
tara:strand:- start:79 stop:543 length:465 start_codon:yes stop_codon:yes gene_type:complete